MLQCFQWFFRNPSWHFMTTNCWLKFSNHQSSMHFRSDRFARMPLRLAASAQHWLCACRWVLTANWDSLRARGFYTGIWCRPTGHVSLWFTRREREVFLGTQQRPWGCRSSLECWTEGHWRWRFMHDCPGRRFGTDISWQFGCLWPRAGHSLKAMRPFKRASTMEVQRWRPKDVLPCKVSQKVHGL